MRTLIIYDSYFGYTEQIARAIKESFGDEAEIAKIQQLDQSRLADFNLIIIGSPTRGFRPTEAIMQLIKSPNNEKFKGMNVATFDTRIELSTIKSRVFRFIVNKGGYAANYMAKELKKAGSNIIIAPEGFYVMGEQGPLKKGELERAFDWTKKITSN